jgi:hypothetical protein
MMGWLWWCCVMVPWDCAAAVRLRWVRVAASGCPPSPRYGHSAAVHERWLYVFGGRDDKRRFDDLYVYDMGKSDLTWFLLWFLLRRLMLSASLLIACC